MTAPDMAAITASLERSLQNCSLNHHHHHHHHHQSSSSSSSSSSGSNCDGGLGALGRSSASDSPGNNLRPDLSNYSDATVELNSQISLPYYWEQCLDLKTGEIYYINWRTGMKVKEDPRTTGEFNGDYYSEDDSSSYDSEESSSESSPSSYRDQYHHNPEGNEKRGQVLVVAGCKSCLMYFMMPKEVEECPKCCGQLLHFDRSDNGSP